MWLKRLLRLSNYGTGSGENGGAGGGMDVGSDFATGVMPGQGSFFATDPPTREELYNARKRRQKRKMLERKRKWRLLRDQQE
jgi:hypothetical protein